MALLWPLVAAVLAGCAPVAARPAAAADGELTLARARQVFSTFVTVDQVARAAGDEALELSLAGAAQLPLTASAYERAGYFGTPLPRYTYGAPQLYVPQLKGFPLWFAAVARRTAAPGAPPQTAIMVFSRVTAAGDWQLSLSTILRPGVAMPRLAVDRRGFATALATFDRRLLISPNSVGALHAAVADDGPAAPAAKLVAAGPYTTGMYQRSAIEREQVNRLGLHYDAMLGGTAFPLYALGTADGGGLVLYSLQRSVVITTRHPRPGAIPVPPSFAPAIYATGLVIRSELDTGETFEYGAYVPPRAATGRVMRVIAADGGPTSAASS